MAQDDAIALVGPFGPSPIGSELAKLRGHAPAGQLPPMDGRAVRDAHDAVRHGINSGALQNAHDIAEGGLAVAIAECCVAGGIGATIELPQSFDLFGEAPGRGFVVSGPEAALREFAIIGRVGGDALEIAGRLKVAVSDLHRARERGLVESV